MKHLGFLVIALNLLGCGSKKAPLEPVTSVAALESLVPDRLKFKPEPLADKDNGYLTLVKATEAMSRKIKWTEVSSLIRGKLSPVQRQEAKGILKDNSRALELYVKAIGQTRWHRTIENGTDALFPELAEGKTLTKMLVLRALVEAGEGRQSPAARDLLLARQSGERLLHCSASLIHYLVGVANCVIAERGMQVAAWKEGLDKGAIQELLAELPNSQSDGALADQLRAEFHNMFMGSIVKQRGPHSHDFFQGLFGEDKLVDVVDKILEGHPRPFDREATVRDAVQVYLGLVQNAHGKWSEQVDVDSQVDELAKEWPGQIAEGIVPNEAQIQRSTRRLKNVENPYGKLLLYLSLPVTSSTIEFKRQVTLDTTKISLANRLYALEHGGSNAPNLKALGLDLRDPFSDKPYHYDPRRQIVWSVGPDGKNDGGLDPAGKLSQEAKDWVTSIRGN